MSSALNTITIQDMHPSTFPENNDLYTRLADTLLSALETLIPGFSLVTRTTFLKYSISFSYLLDYVLSGFLLLVLLIFVVPRALEVTQRLALYFAASVEIKYETLLHEHLLTCVSEHDKLGDCRRYIATTSSTCFRTWKDDEQEHSQDHDATEEQRTFEVDKELYWKSLSQSREIKKIRSTLGQGQIHVFRYQGCLIALRRDHRLPSLMLALKLRLVTC